MNPDDRKKAIEYIQRAVREKIVTRFDRSDIVKTLEKLDGVKVCSIAERGDAVEVALSVALPFTAQRIQVDLAVDGVVRRGTVAVGPDPKLPGPVFAERMRARRRKR